MFKSNPLGTVLAGVLAVAVLGASYLTVKYIGALQTFAKVQEELGRVNRNSVLFQNLRAEAAAYATTNWDIIPIVETMGIRVNTNRNATPNR